MFSERTQNFSDRTQMFRERMRNFSDKTQVSKRTVSCGNNTLTIEHKCLAR